MFGKILKRSEYFINERLNKLSIQVSFLSLSMTFDQQGNASLKLKVLNESHVHNNTNLQKSETVVVGQVLATNINHRTEKDGTLAPQVLP